MPNSPGRESRLPGRLALGTGVVALAGAGVSVATGLLHNRALASDSDWVLLSSPLSGSPVQVQSADGTPLHAEVFGVDEAPTFVLAPGWTEEIAVYDLVTRGLLGRGFRVVVYDLRGQGASGAQSGLDQHIDRYGEDLDAVLRATCDGRDDVVVAGHSLGGMSVVAWAKLSEAPRAQVRAAALIATGMSVLISDIGLLPGAVPAVARRAVIEPLMSAEQPVPHLSTPVSRALLRRLCFGPHAGAGQVELTEQMIWRMDPKLRAGAAMTLRGLDLSEALASLDVPTLVVVGAEDRLTPPIHSRRMVASLPHVAEFLLLPETGHMVPL